MAAKLEKLHKEMWGATDENEEDSFRALVQEFWRETATLSEDAMLLRAMARMASENMGE